MSWLVPIWSMTAAICGAMAVIQLFLWVNGGRRRRYLLPALSAAAAAATAWIELQLFTSSTPERYQALLLWENLLIAMVLVPMVWFLRAYLGSGRRWLALTITALWGLALLINFGFEGTLTFRSVETLRALETPWGEPFFIAGGEINPWQWVANLASILFAVFALDASIQAWRRGRPLQSGLIGGSTVAFILLAGVHTPLVDAGVIPTPYMVSFAFLAIVMGQTYALAHDAVQVPRLTRQVQVDQERWQALLQNVHLAVLGVDVERRITFANPFLLALSGYRETELIGEPVAMLVPVTDASRLEMRVAAALSAGPQAHVQWTLRCASGEERIIMWSTVRQLDLDQEVTGLLSVGADITDQILAQAELRSTQRELDRLLRVGMLGELTSTLTHELNQPLAAILSNAQTGQKMLDRSEPALEELAAILADIARDDKRAAAVIHGMRTMLSESSLEEAVTPLNEAIEEGVRIAQGEISANRIQLALQLGGDLPRVNASRVEIQQVLLNLLLNAVQAMRDLPPQAKRIEISTQRHNESVRVRVTDSGPGVTSEALHEIFEPFFTTRRGGMGMGLSVCRRIVEARGGGIQAHNKPGGGAVFEYWIPVEEEARHG